MKKLLFFCAFALVALSSCAQDVEAIMSRYEKVTGLDKIVKSKDISLLTEMTIEAQSMKIPVKAIMQGDKMRLEMEAMGMKMLMVRNGDKGWMSAGGQVQALPKEAIEQQAKQGDVLANMSWDKTKYDFAYIGEEKSGELTLQKVEATDKDPNAEIKKMTLYFDKATGLVKTAKGSQGGAEVEVSFDEYKDFNGLKLPAVMDTKMAGKSAAKITITNMELDYPTAEWMFVEPTK